MRPQEFSPTFNAMPNPKLPDIPIDALDEDEASHARALRSALSELDTYVQWFASALSLSDHCDELIQAWFKTAGASNAPEPGSMIEAASKWKIIAQENGALQIYHFRQVIEAVLINLNNCPSLKPKVDASDFRLVRRRFNARFQLHGEMRDAIGHAAELTATPQDWERNAVSAGSYSPPGIEALGGGRTVARRVSIQSWYATTKDGKMPTYSLSLSTLNELRRFHDEVLELFAALDADAT